MLTPCLKCLTRPKPLRTPEPLAPSWIAATAAANSLMARRSWCPEELPEHNREQRVRFIVYHTNVYLRRKENPARAILVAGRPTRLSA